MSRLFRRSLVALTASVLLVGCGSSSLSSDGEKASQAPAEPVVLTTNVKDKAKDVGVDTLVQVQAEHGTIGEATLTDSEGKKIPGEVSGHDWLASDRLEPGMAYTLSATATGEDGVAKTLKIGFTTQNLTLDHQTYPAVAPLQDETVGVGMPVIVTFDIPVKDREEFERHMKVTSEPAVQGSWSWFSDREVHFRPQSYWPAGAKVHVDLDLNGVPAGGGIYGQQDQRVDFKIGKKVINKVDLKKHTLTHIVDGKSVRTIPISAGDASHQSRNGIKVIQEKFASVDMDAASTGVDPSDPGYYNMKGVKWAMRVTNSGEFLHAAPWNAGYLGRANMSHGCTGMSTADAGWLYQRSVRGDIVEFTGGSRSLEDRNGWTDWNVKWDDWLDGSALPDKQTTPNQTT